MKLERYNLGKFGLNEGVIQVNQVMKFDLLPNYFPVKHCF